MFNVVVKRLDGSYESQKVKTKEDIRGIIGANIGDSEPIMLTENLILFYNFDKIKEIGHMTGRIVDKDGYPNFVCGDLVICKVDGSQLDSINDDDFETIKTLLVS